MNRSLATWKLSRLGRRFMWASLGVLAVAVVMIVIAAQQMFINDQDLGTLLWIMVPATVAATLAAWVLSAPLARDAHRVRAAAERIAGGDLTARTGVVRLDELGDAAREFDRMAERLAAVERERNLMLSSISHDLRTPLAALRASVEAIGDGIVADPDAHLKGMERQVGALADLVDDLQLHTRLVSGTLEMRRTRVDVTELADETVETLRPLASRSSVRLEIVADARVAIDGDPASLARVMRNLVENAIRHAPGETVVCIEVGADAEHATILVTDQGEGFAPELRDRAFEPFTRGDPARDTRSGTAGLGLAIARDIVIAHAGTIAIVDRRDGRTGAAVSVRLPRAATAGRDLTTT